MKTHNNRLDFSKQTVLDLNDEYLLGVEGGSTPACVSAFVSGMNLSLAITIRIF